MSEPNQLKNARKKGKMFYFLKLFDEKKSVTKNQQERGREGERGSSAGPYFNKTKFEIGHLLQWWAGSAEAE